jgi:lipopolysaccharide heptosyltransferase II
LSHAVDWYLEVLKLLQVPIRWDFEWLPRRPEAAASIRQKWDASGRQWMIMVPGARWLNKRWPVEHYAHLVRELARSHPSLYVAVLGGPDDADLGAAVCHGQGDRCVDLTGRTSLSEMVEWIRLSSIVVTNDTGPMHIAAALAIPVISIFGPTEPRRTGPYRQLGRALRVPLPCAPCLKPACHWPEPLECVRAVTPETVCAQVRELLRP